MIMVVHKLYGDKVEGALKHPAITWTIDMVDAEIVNATAVRDDYRSRRLDLISKADTVRDSRYLTAESAVIAAIVKWNRLITVLVDKRAELVSQRKEPA